MQTVAPPGNLRRSWAPALEGSQQQIHWSVPVSLQRSAEMRMRLGDQSTWLPSWKLQPQLQQLQWRKRLGRRSLPTWLQPWHPKSRPGLNAMVLRWRRPAVWHCRDRCRLATWKPEFPPKKRTWQWHHSMHDAAASGQRHAYKQRHADPRQSTFSQQEQEWGTQTPSPSRRATATRTASSSKRSPQEAMGKALSQSPEWGAVAAKNVAFWRGSVRTDCNSSLMETVCWRLVQSVELHIWMTMMSCTSQRVGHLVGNDIQRGFHPEDWGC